MKSIHIQQFIYIILLFSLSCTQSPPRRSRIPAFYHWQSSLQISPEKDRYLDSLHCQTLYVKFLDIGINPENAQVEPLSRLNVVSKDFLSGKNIVPTVFLTNDVFKNTDPEKIVLLAQKTANALSEIGQFFPENNFSQIQFDCDWTASTREAYFLFLEKIKTFFPKNTQISATIRLHQYKFPDRTGIPPVQRGMLMLYNTGDITAWEEENSIFKTSDALKYLNGAPKHYPLDLDLALPLFSWAIVYRDGGFWKIIAQADGAYFRDYPAFKALSHNRFEVIKGTFLEGHYLRTGDLIRIESISPELLREAALLGRKADLAPESTVAFFQLDSATMRLYPPQLLRELCDSLLVPK